MRAWLVERPDSAFSAAASCVSVRERGAGTGAYVASSAHEPPGRRERARTERSECLRLQRAKRVAKKGVFMTLERC